MTNSGPRTALAQINTTVGDLDGNCESIAAAAAEAVSSGVSLVVFPELCVPGYPAEDLYLRTDFVEANRIALEGLAREL